MSPKPVLPNVDPLPVPLGGTHVRLNIGEVPLALYCLTTPTQSRALPFSPVLLVHSINASASAFEVKPLYDHYGKTRPTYALDLPGYGLSDRSDRPYTLRLMTDALLEALAHIRIQHPGAAVDVLGVSLSCEYVARAACEMPDVIRRIALISPTGFSGSKRYRGAPGSSRGIAWLYRLLSNPKWSGGLFNTLTQPTVIRYFLKRTFGTEKIDEALWRYDVLTTRQSGAKHAPLYFLSAYLFAADINTMYESLTCPVFVSMATRGDFTDYQGRTAVSDRPNWQFHSVEGGALPYFENVAGFTAKLDQFFSSDFGAMP